MDDNTGKVECECANWKSENMFECFSSCWTGEHFELAFRFLLQAGNVQEKKRYLSR